MDHSLVRHGRCRKSVLSGDGFVFVTGAEFGRPGCGAGFVGAPAPVDDDYLVAAATLVHHRCGRGHILGGCGRRRDVLLQAGSASVELQEQRKHQPKQNAAAVQRPAADAHRVGRMFTTWRAAAFGSVDDDEKRWRSAAEETTAATERDARACDRVALCGGCDSSARARAAPDHDGSGFIIS